MTISSALVGFPTGGQRQISSVDSPDPATPNAVPALQAGAWSAIDWEFGSVLRALIPDAAAEPVKSGIDGKKAEPAQPTGVPTALPQTSNSTPVTLPVSFLFAFQRQSTQLDVVPATPQDVTVEPKSGDPKAVAVSVTTPTPTVVRTVPRLFARVESAKSIPVQTSDVAAALRPAAVPPGPGVDAPAKDSENSVPPPVKENYLEAEVVGSTPVRTSDVVPTLFLFPRQIHAESLPKDPKSDAVPVKENTLEAEVVGTPAIQTLSSVPTPPPASLPQAIHVESEPKVTVDLSASVKDKISVGPTAIRTSEIAPRRGPELADSQAAIQESSTPSANPLPPQSRTEFEPVSAKQNPPEAPVSPAATVAVPISASVPQPTRENPTKEITSAPVVISKMHIANQPAVIQTPIEKKSVHLEGRQPSAKRLDTSDPTPESPINTLKPTQSPVVELQAPSTPAPEPIVTVENKSADSAPRLTAISEDQTIPAPALTDSKDNPAPSATPNVAASVLQSAVGLAATPPPITRQKCSDDLPKSQSTGLVSVEESKPARPSTEESRDLPASPADKKPADLGQASVMESKGPSDGPSPNDTEIAFTGRLVPRKVADEPVSRPDSVEPKPEKVSAPVLPEIQDAPVERQVRPVADVEHRTTLHTEPAVVVSAIHRDTVPAADSPAETVSSARTPRNEIIQEPVNHESAGPVREISMRFNDQAQDSAHLRVVEKGGEVLVSVRSGSEQLARTLSSDLGELTHRLEQTGFQAELYRPTAASSSSEPGQDRRDNSSTADQNPNQSWSRERGDSQHHPGQKSREWVEDLEESMGLSQ